MRAARETLGWVAEQTRAGVFTPEQGLKAASIMAGATLSHVAASNIDYEAVHAKQDAVMEMLERKFSATPPPPAPMHPLPTPRVQRSRRPWLLPNLHEGPGAPTLPGL